jgi:uncharacterized membrane protein
MLLYVLSAIVMLLLDAIYLTSIKKYFNKQIKSIQGTNIQFKFVPALITYIFLIFGINYFIIRKRRSIKDAAILGMVIYGVYEFTNLTLFKNWRLLTAFIDTLWGTILFALTAAIVYKINDFIIKAM